MKKLFSSLVISGILATSVCTYAETTSWKADKATFKVMVRGEEFISENPAIVVEGRTYLPLRAMGNALDVNVEWNAELKQAEVAMSEKEPASGEVKPPVQAVVDTVTSWKAEKATFKVMVRGEEFISENPPIVVEGRTYLPLRALGGVLGVDVEWNAELKQAEVAMKATSTPVTTPVTTPVATSDSSTTSTAEPTPRPTSAADIIGVTIGSVEAKAGEVVEIPITLSNLSTIGVSTTDFSIVFDTDNFDYKEVVAGEIVTNAGVNFAANYSLPDPKVTPKPGDEPDVPKIKFLFLDYTMKDEPIVKNGVFATIKLKVKEDAKVGEYSIANHGKFTFGDNLLTSMSAEFTAGKITVVE